MNSLAFNFPSVFVLSFKMDSNVWCAYHQEGVSRGYSFDAELGHRRLNAIERQHKCEGERRCQFGLLIGLGLLRILRINIFVLYIIRGCTMHHAPRTCSKGVRYCRCSSSGCASSRLRSMVLIWGLVRTCSSNGIQHIGA